MSSTSTEKEKKVEAEDERAQEESKRLYTFDSDPVMKAIFGEHLVNVVLQSNNNFFNSLNKNTHFSVCFNIADEKILIEMR